MFGLRWLGGKRIASSSVLCIEEKSLKPDYSWFLSQRNPPVFSLWCSHSNFMLEKGSLSKLLTVLTKLQQNPRKVIDFNGNGIIRKEHVLIFFVFAFAARRWNVSKS